MKTYNVPSLPHCVDNSLAGQAFQTHCFKEMNRSFVKNGKKRAQIPSKQIQGFAAHITDIMLPSQRALNRTPYRVHQCHSLNGNCLKGLLVCDMRYFFLSRRKAAKAGISVQVPSNGNKTHGCLPCQDVSFSKDSLLGLEGN